MGFRTRTLQQRQKNRRPRNSRPLITTNQANEKAKQEEEESGRGWWGSGTAVSRPHGSERRRRLLSQMLIVRVRQMIVRACLRACVRAYERQRERLTCIQSKRTINHLIPRGRRPGRHHQSSYQFSSRSI